MFILCIEMFITTFTIKIISNAKTGAPAEVLE